MTSPISQASTVSVVIIKLYGNETIVSPGLMDVLVIKPLPVSVKHAIQITNLFGFCCFYGSSTWYYNFKQHEKKPIGFIKCCH